MFSRLALRNVATRIPALARVQSSAAAAPPDFSNRPERPVEPSPVRHGFIPEEWFQAFYNKTGYTGPYAFFFGVTTYLVSKEIYVLEHEFYTGVSVFIMSVAIVKKLGPQLAAYLDEGMDKEEAELQATRTSEIQSHQEFIDHVKKEKWRTEAQAWIVDAKKENIKIQLEAAYRERIHRVYTEVKKRLDYQLQIANVERRVAQKHMSEWIINSVLKAITPEQEKATLQQCIAELQGLAPKA
ncbi:ATP synthase subunit b, mitochondrial [Diachasma alloeum]|uniref:ATP synthase subunit b n=1 Tax=Diachasma alloeum TaxID=454923 RepID=A0A4E0RYQ0_9HYME|nr:ATP synthase subunit b, mitochondrial [Diachasma alloeum]THK32841.1 B chain, ATP synthase [Diachasma alloeum]